MSYDIEVESVAVARAVGIQRQRVVHDSDFQAQPPIAGNCGRDNPLYANFVVGSVCRRSGYGRQALRIRLIGAITPRNIAVITTGIKKTRHESLNFHACEPDTIAEIDELYLSALGLPREPLLTQLRELRSGGTWRVGTG